MPKKWPNKDPDEVLDYAFSWTPRNIGTDVILIPVAERVEESAGAEELVIDSSAVADAGQLAKYNAEETVLAASERRQPSLALEGQLQIVWLSKGIAGSTRDIQLRATTNSGRTLDDTVRITIKER